MVYIGGTTLDIIQAEGLPPEKMSVLITIRVTAPICPRARSVEPDADTVHRPAVSEAGRGSLLVSKPGSFLPSAEGLLAGLRWPPAFILVIGAAAGYFGLLP